MRKTEPLNTVIMPIFGDGVLGRDGYHIALRAFFKKKIAQNYRIEACKKIHTHYRVTEFDKKSAIFAIVIISVIFILFQHK